MPPVLGMSAVHSARTPDSNGLTVRNFVSGFTRCLRSFLAAGAGRFSAVTFFLVATFERTGLVVVVVICVSWLVVRTGRNRAYFTFRDYRGTRSFGDAF